jgi:hypothetical protein
MHVCIQNFKRVMLLALLIDRSKICLVSGMI